MIEERGTSFDKVISLIEEEQVLDIIEHPNQDKYPGQIIYVLPVNGYVYFVPFEIIDANIIHLKTIFANRKATKHYMKGRHYG